MSPRQTPPAADADANRHRSPSPYTPYLVTYNPNAAHLQSKRSRSPIIPSSSLSSQTTSPIMTNIQPHALSGQPSSSLSRAHSHSHSRSFSQIHQHYSQSLAHLDAGPSSHRMSSLYSLRSPSQTPTSCQQDTVVMTDKVELLFRNDTRGPIINQYAIGPKLGGGQHGEVFKGYDITKDNMVVAIKACKRKNKKEAKLELLRQRAPGGLPNTRTLNADGRPQVVDNIQSAEKKVLREIAIMKKCQHGQIVQLLEVINDKLVSKILLVMEYMGGGEVKWRDERGHPCLRVDQTRRICRDVVLGLEYLHHQGIIHRDIKPANLLWTEDRMNVKITDFGVSHFSANQRIDVLKHSPGFREIMKRKRAERRAELDKTGQTITRKRSVGVSWKGKGKARAEVDPEDEDDPDLEAEVLAELLKGSLDPILLDDAEGGLSRQAGTPSFLAPEIIWEFGESHQKSFLRRMTKKNGSKERGTKKSRTGSRMETKGGDLVESRGRDGGDMDRAPAWDTPQQRGQDSDGDCGPPSILRGTNSPFDPSSPQAPSSSPPSSSPSAAILDWKRDSFVPVIDSREHAQVNLTEEKNEEDVGSEGGYSSDSSIPLPPRPPITKAIDVWALGVTLYCLLFGRTPWSGGNEYILYQLINSEDFTVDEKMGYDRIVTGGRGSAREEGVSSQSEGAIVIGLLERLLDKDCTKRITLEEVKSLSWITRDIPNPAAWLEETAPARHDPITVTGADEGVAVSSVRFRWWAGITKQFSRIRNAMPRPPGRGQQDAIDPRLGDLAEYRKVRDASHKTENLYQQQHFAGRNYPERHLPDLSHVDAEVDADIDASDRGHSEYGEYESEPPQSRSLSRPATPVTRLANEGLTRKPSRSRRVADAVERGVRKISRHGSSIHGFGASSGGSGGEQTPKRLKRRTVPELMTGSRARSRDSSRSQPNSRTTSRRRVVSGGNTGYASCSNLTSPSTAEFTSDGENGIFDEEDVRRVQAKEQRRVREQWIRDASSRSQDSDSLRRRTNTRPSLAKILGWRPHGLGLGESSSSLALARQFARGATEGEVVSESRTSFASQRLARRSADEVGSGRSTLGVRSGRGRRSGSRGGTQATLRTSNRVGTSMVSSSHANALASADELTSAMRAASWGDEYGYDYGYGANPSGEFEFAKADDYSDYGDYPYLNYLGNGSGYYGHDGGDERDLEDDDEMRLVGAGGILSHPVSGPSSPNSLSGVSVVLGVPQPDGFSLNAAVTVAAQLTHIQTQGEPITVNTRRRGTSVSGYYNINNPHMPASSPLAQTPLSANVERLDGMRLSDSISDGEPRFARVRDSDDSSDGELRVPSSRSSRSGECVYGQGSMSFSVDAEVPDEDDPDDALFNVRCGPPSTLNALRVERGRETRVFGDDADNEHGESGGESSGSEEPIRLEVRRRRPSEIARSQSRSRPLLSPGSEVDENPIEEDT